MQPDRAALVADGRSSAEVKRVRLAIGGATVTLRAVGIPIATPSAVVDNGDGNYPFRGALPPADFDVLP